MGEAEQTREGEEPADEAAGEESGGLTRGERSIVRRISQALRFADLIALLMVAATLMSAFATWRTASLTQTLFSVSERPYVGVASVSLEEPRGDHARVRLDFRNFGHVFASDGVARVWILINGKRMARASDAPKTMNVGMISPTVPHYAYRTVPADVYNAVKDGKVKMVVRSALIYRGPDQREFCYNELFAYDVVAETFVSMGGNDRCGKAIY